jgi:hypothetical protein
MKISIHFDEGEHLIAMRLATIVADASVRLRLAQSCVYSSGGFYEFDTAESKVGVTLNGPNYEARVPDHLK